MSIYPHHIFVCTNQREASDPKGSCGPKGSESVLEAFRSELKKRALKIRVRANKAGCLDQCARGVVVVIYPEATWYAKVQAEDVAEIVDAMLEGRSVERLRL